MILGGVLKQVMLDIGEVEFLQDVRGLAVAGSDEVEDHTLRDSLINEVHRMVDRHVTDVPVVVVSEVVCHNLGRTSALHIIGCRIRVGRGAIRESS